MSQSLQRAFWSSLTTLTVCLKREFAGFFRRCISENPVGGIRYVGRILQAKIEGCQGNPFPFALPGDSVI